MKTAFGPFGQYMDFLAKGKLDGYLKSNNPEDKFVVSDIEMSTDVNLLLNQLGEYVDMEKILELFDRGTV